MVVGSGPRCTVRAGVVTSPVEPFMQEGMRPDYLRTVHLPPSQSYNPLLKGITGKVVEQGERDFVNWGIGRLLPQASSYRKSVR